MTLSDALSQYGYLAVFLGTILEGETILILVGFAIHQGYMSFPLVLLSATAGGTIGDQLFFFLGRYFGGPLLSRFPRLQSHTEHFNQLIRNHQAVIILGVRFMYGLRIAGPVAIGMSSVSTRRFVLLNPVGAVIWATLIISAGYLLGQTLQLLIVDIKKYESLALLVIMVLMVLVWAIRYWLKHSKSH